MQGEQLSRVMPNGISPACKSPGEHQGVVRGAHEMLGHFGSRRTVAMVQISHWQGMYEDVRAVVRTCKVCDQANSGGRASPDQLSPLPVMCAFYRWGSDTAGDMPRTKRGNVYIHLQHRALHQTSGGNGNAGEGGKHHGRIHVRHRCPVRCPSRGAH
jgi:hypothetical protein